MPKNRIIPALAIFALGPLAVWAQAPSSPAAGQSAPASVPGALPGLSKDQPAASSSLVPDRGATVPGMPAAPAVEEPPTEADKEVDAAIKKVEALKAVSADIQQQVDMLGQRFELKGQYIKGPSYRIYMKLSVAGLGDTSGTMLQVCDGSTLWDFQQVLESKRFLKLDLAKVLKRMDTPDFDTELKKQVIASIGFAGPESLLVGLRKSLRFERKDAETLDGKAVWVLRGKWKDPSKLVGPNQAPLPATAAIPAYMPSVATVWIGQEDGWPYKILLEGRRSSVLEDTRETDLNGRPIGRKAAAPSVQPSRILLLYTNVQLNPELKPEGFAFQAPPDATVIDSTEQLLISLEQASAMQAEQKKSQAAKETELPEAISIPKPPVEEPAPPKTEAPTPLKGSSAPAPKGPAAPGPR